MKKRRRIITIGILSAALFVWSFLNTPKRSQHSQGVHNQKGISVSAGKPPPPKLPKGELRRLGGALEHGDVVEKMKRLKLAYKAGGCSRLDWEVFWRDWAREDWRSAVQNLGDYAFPAELDGNKFSAFVSGLQLTQIPEVLDFARKTMPAGGLTRLCMEVLVQNAQAMSTSEVLALGKRLPREASAELIGQSIYNVLAGREDVKSALNSLASQPPSEGQSHWDDQFVASIFAVASFTEGGAVLSAYMQSSYGARIETLEPVVKVFVTKDPQLACELLSQGTGSAVELCTGIAMENWSAQNPEAAGEWLNAHNNSRGFQWLVAGYVAGGQSHDAQAVEAWRKLVSDPKALEFIKSKQFQ